MSQQRKILDYLQAGNPLTNADAVRLFRAYRLSGQIYALIKKGHIITCEMVYTTNMDGDPIKYGIYRYEGEAEDGEA